MKNVISIIDPICKKNEHFMFNLSLLRYFGVNSNYKNVNFYCYKSNKLIIDELDDSIVNLFLIKDKKSYTVRTIYFFFKIFFSRKVIKSERIILLAIDNTLMSFLFILNIFLLPFLYTKISIISHNNLYTLKTNKLKKTIFRIFLFLYKPKMFFLSNCFENEFRNKVFNRNIHGVYHQNFQDIIFSLYPNYNKRKDIFNKNNNEYKKIFVSKSYVDFFLKIYNSCFDYFEKNNYKSKIIIKYVSNNSVEFKNTNSIFFERVDIPIDMEKYFSLLHESDLVFFPEDLVANHRASGVLMDALSVKTNFIAPNIGHFKDINEKYKIGLVYNNNKEFIEIFNKILFNEINIEIDENKINELLNDTNPSVLAKHIFE